MSTITVTQLYEQLTRHMGKDTSESLCSYINCKISEELEDQTKILASKADIHELKEATKVDINELRLAGKEDVRALKSDMEELRLSTKEDTAVLRSCIDKLRLDTKTDIEALRLATMQVLMKFSESKAETMRWMFIFWVGQVAATFGLLMLFIKK